MSSTSSLPRVPIPFRTDAEISAFLKGKRVESNLSLIAAADLYEMDMLHLISCEEAVTVFSAAEVSRIVVMFGIRSSDVWVKTVPETLGARAQSADPETLEAAAHIAQRIEEYHRLNALAGN